MKTIILAALLALAPLTSALAADSAPAAKAAKSLGTASAPAKATATQAPAPERSPAGLTIVTPPGTHRASFLAGLQSGGARQAPVATLGACAPLSASLRGVSVVGWSSWADVPTEDTPCACASDWKPSAPAGGCFVVRWQEASPQASATPANAPAPVASK